MRPVAAISAFLLLSGCVAVWGSAYNIEAESDTGVTITYDPSLTSSGAIEAVAAQECGRYQKVAVPKSQTFSAWALARISFVCDTRLDATREARARLNDMVFNPNPSPVRQNTNQPTGTDPVPVYHGPSNAPPDTSFDPYKLPPKPETGCIGVVPVPIAGFPERCPGHN